jgi:hypothetical protein
VYYYRRRLPSPHVGEVAVSLRTPAFREAEWRAHQLDQEFKRALERVNATNSKTDIQRILRLYLKQRLDFDMARRTDSPQRPAFPVVGTPRGIAIEDLEFVDAELRKARHQLAERLYDHQRPLIDEVMEAHNVPAEHRNAIAHGILRANVELWETIRRRTLGEFDPTIEAPPARPETNEQVNCIQEPEGPLFTEVLPGFLEFMTMQKGWRGQTLAQNKATYRMFVQCCGDRPITHYQRQDLAKFFDLLRTLPQLYSKKKEWAGLPLPEIARMTAGQDIPRVTMKTVRGRVKQSLDYIVGQLAADPDAHVTFGEVMAHLGIADKSNFKRNVREHEDFRAALAEGDIREWGPGRWPTGFRRTYATFFGTTAERTTA